MAMIQMSKYDQQLESAWERWQEVAEDRGDLIDQVEVTTDPWQFSGVTVEEAESRVSQYNRLLDFVGAGQGRWGRGWEASFDVDLNSWLFQSHEENESRQLDADTPHEEILVWIVKRFDEEVPY